MNDTDGAFREGELPILQRGSALPATTASSRDDRPYSTLARLLAIVLALGGCLWGLLLSPWMFSAEVSLLAVVVFGPGYLVTLGYIVRSVSTPPKEACLLIWVSSLLVQGAWLLYLIWGVIEKAVAGGSATRDIANIMTAWWVFAVAASLAGLLADMKMRRRTNG